MAAVRLNELLDDNKQRTTMKIKTIVSQSRRDFRAVYECEHCGHEENGSGYDDDNFHRNVIPNKACEKCGKTAATDYHPMGTKYAEHVVV